MRLFGLVGYPVAQSQSPAFFHQLFEKEGIVDAEYRLSPLKDIRFLPELMAENPDWVGFNVTHPHKQAVMSYMDSLTREAEEVGAVNTVLVMRENGKVRLVGHNTDGAGFACLLREACPQLPRAALVLGTGGAAKAVFNVLKNNEIETAFVSRQPEKGDYTYNELTPSIIQRYNLIINATPLGMACDTRYPNIPYSSITQQHTLIDLVYNPVVTPFMQKGRERAARVFNGLTMLHEQALASWKFWNGGGECLFPFSCNK